MTEIDEKMSPSEYRSLKMKKREALKRNRDRNIKRVVVGIVLGLIIFGIGNHFYDEYQHEIYRARNQIMSMNERLVSDYIRNLRYRSNVISDMLFDRVEDRDLERTILTYSKVSLRDFYKDYNTYYMSDWSVEEYENSLYVITDLLEKESLNEVEKEGLAKILGANTEIIKGYEAIYQDVNYEEHREELRYLYYYKGEMYYMLNNLISVVGADLDYDFYDLERIDDYVDDSMDRSISEDEVRAYADRLYEFLFNDQDGLLEEERNYYNNPQDKRELGSITYVADAFRLNENIDSSSEGHVDYSYYGYEVERGVKDSLGEEEIKALADIYIGRLNQPMLEFYSIDSHKTSADNDKEFRRYNVSYMIRNVNYVDIYNRVDISYSEYGDLLGFSVGDGLLLSQAYVEREPKLSPEEAAMVLDKELQDHVERVVLEVNSRYVYHVIFKQYGETFVADVHGETGELMSIVAEDMVYTYY